MDGNRVLQSARAKRAYRVVIEQLLASPLIEATNLDVGGSS